MQNWKPCWRPRTVTLTKSQKWVQLLVWSILWFWSNPPVIYSFTGQQNKNHCFIVSAASRGISDHCSAGKSKPSDWVRPQCLCCGGRAEQRASQGHRDHPWVFPLLQKLKNKKNSSFYLVHGHYVWCSGYHVHDKLVLSSSLNSSFQEMDRCHLSGGGIIQKKV